MIEFKPNVRPSNVHPAIWTALGIAYALRMHYAPASAPLVVTAMEDNSGHMIGSYHYPASTPTHTCQAVDLRTEDLSDMERLSWGIAVRDLLKPLGYDVVNESPETTGKPLHLHIEYQPHALDTDWTINVTGPSGDYKHANSRT